MAPMTLPVAAMRREANSIGSDRGARSRQKVSHPLADSTCISSSSFGVARVRPRTMAIRVGKKQITAAIMIFGSMPRPNIRMMIGASASTGMVLKNSTTGNRRRGPAGCRLNRIASSTATCCPAGSPAPPQRRRPGIGQQEAPCRSRACRTPRPASARCRPACPAPARRTARPAGSTGAPSGRPQDVGAGGVMPRDPAASSRRRWAATAVISGARGRSGPPHPSAAAGRRSPARGRDWRPAPARVRPRYTASTMLWVTKTMVVPVRRQTPAARRSAGRG